MLLHKVHFELVGKLSWLWFNKVSQERMWLYIQLNPISPNCQCCSGRENKISSFILLFCTSVLSSQLPAWRIGLKGLKGCCHLELKCSVLLWLPWHSILKRHWGLHQNQNHLLLTFGGKVIGLGWGLRKLFLAWFKWVMITFSATQVHSLFGPLKYGKFCKATIHCYHVCHIDRNVWPLAPHFSGAPQTRAGWGMSLYFAPGAGSHWILGIYWSRNIDCDIFNLSCVKNDYEILNLAIKDKNLGCILPSE